VRLDDVGAELLPQERHIVVERLACGSREVFAPELLQQDVGRD
jgi:hypothetical protein